ncbi:nucleotide disphospho-sugar-binding domain-containing protein [Streptomyces sp. NPDC003032]
MRVLLTTSGWAGDYVCLVPFGWALQAAGHEVRVACTPAQTAAVRGGGLVPVPVLDAADMMRMARLGHLLKSAAGSRIEPGLPFPLHPVTDEPVGSLDELDLTALQMELWLPLAEAARRSADGIVGFARAWRPDLVLHSLNSEEGPLAARAVGVPAVYCPPGFFGAVETGALDLGPDDPTGNFPRHGLALWSRAGIRTVVDPTPGGVALPHGGADVHAVRYVPYNGAGHLPEGLDRDGRRRAVVLWGRSGSGIFGTELAALRYALEETAALGLDVRLAAGADQIRALGPVPDGVSVLGQVPLHLFLPGADVLIHHGSANVLMNGHLAGVPQIALALADDTIEVSRRSDRTGASRTLPGLLVSRAQVAEAVAAALDDGTQREAAQRTRAGLLDRPSPAGLVPVWEELALGTRAG